MEAADEKVNVWVNAWVSSQVNVAFFLTVCTV